MSRVSALPRTISPASIETRDHIKVVWTTGNVKRTIEGIVARKIYEGNVRIFMTEDEQELLRWHPSLTTNRKVYLLASNAGVEPESMLSLFEEQGRI